MHNYWILIIKVNLLILKSFSNRVSIDIDSKQKHFATVAEKLKIFNDITIRVERNFGLLSHI